MEVKEMNSRLAFIVEPLTGIGPIMLGMSRNDVRKQFGGNFESYLRWGSTVATDTFFGNSFQIYYNSNDEVNFIELSGYKSAYFDVQLFGVNPFAIKVNELDEYLKSKDIKIVYEQDSGIVENINEAYSIRLPEYGVTLWRSGLPEPEDYEISKNDYDEYGNGFYWLTIAVADKEYWAK
jgi:hypothetical protein